MAKTTVNQGDNDQYKTTVPKALGDAFELDGKKLSWTVKSKNRMEVEVVDE